MLAFSSAFLSPFLCIIAPIFSFLFHSPGLIRTLPSLSLINLRYPNNYIQPWNYISAFVTASLATAALYAREDVVTTIVTTLPGTTGYTVIPGTTIEATITRTLATITGTGTETDGTLESYTASTSYESVEFSISCSSDGESSNQCNSLTEATTSFPVDDTSYLSYTGTSTPLELTEVISTEVQIAESVTEITTDGITTQVTLEGITTTFTTTLSTSVDLVASASTVTIEPIAYTLTVPEESRSSDSAYSTTTTLSATEITLSVDSVSTSSSLESISTELTQITTLKITIPESTSSFTSSDIVSSYVTTIPGTETGESSSTEESTSDTNVSSSEESSTTEESTTSEESSTSMGSTTESATESGSATTNSMSESVYTSDGSVYTTDVEVPLTTLSVTASQPQSSANVPTAPAGSLNTACSVVLGPMSGEDVALLEVIFSGTIDGTTYVQWLVNYTSQLTRQIDNVAAQALADSGRQYTTAFNTIDITGILGLASAAPMYTCVRKWNTVPSSLFITMRTIIFPLLSSSQTEKVNKPRR